MKIIWHDSFGKKRDIKRNYVILRTPDGIQIAIPLYLVRRAKKHRMLTKYAKMSFDFTSASSLLRQAAMMRKLLGA